MKKIVSALSLIGVVLFTLVSCQQSANDIGPWSGTGKGEANAKGGPPEKVMLCHTDADGVSTTLVLVGRAAEVHIAHGDPVGSCTPTGTGN